MPKNRYGITLIELIVALILMFIVVLGISSIDVFSHRHVITAERRAKLQNEATFLLEHMAKNVATAVGNANAGQPMINTSSWPTGPFDFLRVFVAGGPHSSSYNDPSNHWIGYGFNKTPCCSMDYCGNCTDDLCSNCKAGYEEPAIVTKIFSAGLMYDDTKNYIYINVYTCWDPSESHSSCGMFDNPAINMSAYLPMPSVATN